MCGAVGMMPGMKDSMSSEAVRKRRFRAHARGDHRHCSGWDRCDAGMPIPGRAGKVQVPERPAVAPPAPPPPSGRGVNADRGVLDEVPDIPDERVPGGIEAAVVAFVEALPYREPDPRALLGQIAVRLAQRVDETGAMPAAVRELRTMLMQLTEVPNQPTGPLDEHRLRRAQHRLDGILSGMS